MTALADRPDVSGLAMIACYPTAEQAATLAPADGNEAETMHVTLVFLGETSELDMEAARRAVASVAAKTQPLTGAVGGVGLFGEGEDGYPQIALPDAKGLSSLRTHVVDALAAEGIESPSEHDWVPHLTLAYVGEPALPDVAVIGAPLSFDGLSLTVADVREDYQFGAASSSLSRSEQRQMQLLLAKARSL